MYSPVNSSRKSGSNGETTIHIGGGPNAIATKLAMTVIVKMIDTQR